MATFYSTTQNGYFLRLDIAQGTQDIANNRTIFAMTLYLGTGATTFAASTAGAAFISPPYQGVWSAPSSFSALTPHALYTLYSSSFWIAHNADGTGAGGASAWYQTQDQSSFWRVPRLDVSGSISFTRIPRGPRVRESNVWRNTLAYVKVAGVWRTAIPYVKSGGTWKVGGG